MLEILFLLVLIVGLTWSAWIDVLWIGGVALALFAAATWLVGDPTKFAWLLDPVTLASLVVVSLGIGALWSLFKWRKHVRSDYVQERLEVAMADFVVDEKRKTERFGADFVHKPFIESSHFPDTAKASYNKERIMTWWLYWPFSMIVYFFDDFLRDVFNWLYERLAGVFHRVTLSALTEDMKK